MYKAILNHSKTDPNAKKHMVLGGIGALVLTLISIIFIQVFSQHMILYLIPLLFGGLFTGIAIELVQRVQRIGHKQNTIKESFLDIGVTACWFLLII